MKKATYILETCFKFTPAKKESIIGTRVEARQRCRAIDTGDDGRRKPGQATGIAFVRYEP